MADFYCPHCGKKIEGARNRRRPFVERFWEKVSKRGDDDCWVWLGTTAHGYGKIEQDYKLKSVHRVSYELAHGAIPDGLLIRHRCNNRLCVNPAHLLAGTGKDNANDQAVAGHISKKQARLTGEQASEIRRLYALEGVSLDVLAARYDVTPPTIWRIVHRKSWKEVP